MSEQTSLDEGIVGDLFMIGDTEYLLDWWSCLPWDYSKNGLRNLYKNLKHKEPDVDKFVNEKAEFISPPEAGWITLEHNWDRETKKLISTDELSNAWGKPQGFGYYGGFK